jgi:hypothetical protein
MTTTVNLSYLIPRLRLHLGDIDADNYRHLDEWLRLSLVVSVETLQKWWNYKYLIDDNNDVYRNPRITFLHSQPPVIERGDIKPIILMSAIMIKSGDLENLSWNVGAWRDAEISYSNIEASRRKDEMIKRDWEELTSILKPPQKRLAESQKGHLAGYKGNPFEYD